MERRARLTSPLSITHLMRGNAEEFGFLVASMSIRLCREERSIAALFEQGYPLGPGKDEAGAKLPGN